MNIIKIFLLFIITLFFTTCKKAIEVHEASTPFGSIYGMGGDQELNGVLKTSDGDYILYGTTNIHTHGGNDGFIMKVNSDLNVMWMKQYGAHRDESFSSLAIDEDGNMLAVGMSNSFGSSIDSNYKTPNNLIYLAYISKQGDFIRDTFVQPNPSSKNITSQATKVLFLPNKTFAVLGTTYSFQTNIGSSSYTTSDIYLFGVNKELKRVWACRYFEPYVSIPGEAHEIGSNLFLSDDGNILMEMVRGVFFPMDGKESKIIKIQGTGPITSSNSFLWKGDPFYTHGIAYHVPMAKTPDDGLISYDYYIKGLDFINSSGKVTKQVLFKNNQSLIDITNTGENYLLTTCADLIGEGPNNTRINNPGWMLMDYNGNILEEKYVKVTGDLNNVIFNRVFFTTKGEVVVFGTITGKEGTNIILLRLDHNGNIIK